MHLSLFRVSPSRVLLLSFHPLLPSACYAGYKWNDMVYKFTGVYIGGWLGVLYVWDELLARLSLKSNPWNHESFFSFLQNSRFVGIHPPTFSHLNLPPGPSWSGKNLTTHIWICILRPGCWASLSKWTEIFALCGEGSTCWKRKIMFAFWAKFFKVNCVLQWIL